jgi:hypothetical protein
MTDHYDVIVIGSGAVGQPQARPRRYHNTLQWYWTATGGVNRTPIGHSG